MARRRRSSLSISAEQARQALGVLVHDGKLAVADVLKALKRREGLIRELKSRLDALGEGTISAERRLRKSLARVGRSARKTSTPSRIRAKHAISATTRKMYQAQGRYMSALRPLPKEARAKIKEIRAKSGIHAAIAAAKRQAK